MRIPGEITGRNNISREITPDVNFKPTREPVSIFIHHPEHQPKQSLAGRILPYVLYRVEKFFEEWAPDELEPETKPISLDEYRQTKKITHHPSTLA